MSPFLIGMICGLIAMFGWGIGEATAKLAVKKIGEVSAYFWVQLIIWIIFLLIWVSRMPSFSDISGLVLLFTFIIGATYSLAYVFAYKAYDKGKLALVSPILCSYGMLSSILAWLFLGQRLSILQFVAITLIVLGTIAISIDLDDLKNGGKLKVLAGVKEALLAFVFFGVNSVFLDYVSELADINIINILNSTFSLILVGLYFIVSKKRISTDVKNKSTLLPILLTALFTFLANYFFLYGYTVGDSIIIGPLGAASGVVTALVSVFIFKEKVNWVQAVSIAVVFAGIVLLVI